LHLYEYEPSETVGDYHDIISKAGEEGSNVFMFLNAVKVSQKVQRRSYGKGKNTEKTIEMQLNDDKILQSWKDECVTEADLNTNKDMYLMALRTKMKDFNEYLLYLTDKVNFRESLSEHEALCNPKEMESFLKRFKFNPERLDYCYF
jgi:hypothetical protein